MRHSILAVLTLALAAPAVADKKLDDAIAKAEDQFQKGKADEALKTLQKAVSQSPGSPEGHLALARLQQRIGSLSEAGDAAKQAIATVGAATTQLKADVYTYASSLALLIGTGRDAVAHAQEAVKVQPDAASYAALARAQVRAQDPIGALGNAEKALQAGGSSASAHEANGDALAALRRYDEAIAAYKKALQSDPKLNRARVGLANALILAGKPSEAVAEAREATRVDERDADAFALLGLALLAENPQQKWNEAIAEAQQGAFLNPRSVVVQLAVAKIFEAAGNYDQAAVAYKKVEEVDPQALPTQFAIDQVMRQHPLTELDKKWKKGKETPGWNFEKARTQFAADQAWQAYAALKDKYPQDGRALVAYAQLLMIVEDYPGALAAATDAVKKAPHLPEANALAGALYQYSGRTDDALASYKKALDLDSKNLSYRATYGLLLGIAGRYEEGAAELQKVVTTPGYKDSAGYTNLGWLYRTVTPRKTAEAVAAYKKALELDPKNGQAALGMGWAFSYQRSYDEAIASYQQAARIDPTLQDEANNGIAWCYFFKRDLDQAKQWLGKAGTTGRADSRLAEQIEKLEHLQAQREAYEEALRRAEEERAKGGDLGTLARQAATGDTAGRIRAVRELRGLGAQAVPSLIRVIDADNPMPVREAAVNALGEIGPSAKQAIPYLMEVLRTECGKTVMDKKEMESALKCEELKLKARDAVLKIQK